MSRSRSGVSDGVLVALIGSIVLLAGLVWLWGGVAGAVFGDGWPRVSGGELARILVRLPGHLGDPAQAWPASTRPLLPSAVGFYGALALLTTVVWLAVVLLVRAGAARLPSGRAAGAKWARATELRLLHRGAETTRLALGRKGGRLLYAEQRHALVVFGPPQSGKSAGLAVPALLEWEGPVVASCIKTDLLAATVKRRRQLGAVYVFDPFERSGVQRHTWSPLHCARTWDGAREVAGRLAGAAELDQRGVERGDFWALAAEQRLAPLLYTAAATGAGMDAVARWIYGQGSRELELALARLSEHAADDQQLGWAHNAFDAIQAFAAQADRTRSSIEATAQALLRAYQLSRVQRSARGAEITPDRLLSENATLYLVGDAKASRLLRPIFLALVTEVVDHAYEQATRNGGELGVPLLLCLDDAGNVAPLPHLAEIASSAPSHNVQLLSIFHDLAQVRSRYGRQAETVINSHKARMLVPGVADLDTLRYFAGLVGEEELVPAEALRQLPDRHALLVYGRLPPTRLKLRMWFNDRRLRRLAKC